ncbi:arabinofuranosyltransferase [Solwaraspora sp. WMMB335]|uniref:arabinofuranosyltransferase n=1 Tax=Solwaraspora sp. WMMB335 TaxID=3404118 RepID=UPI003B9445EE
MGVDATSTDLPDQRRPSNAGERGGPDASAGALDRTSGAARSRWASAGHPALLAVLVWAVAVPVAWRLPSVADRDPFSPSGRILPVTGGLLLICLVLLAAAVIRRFGPPAGVSALSGVGAGLAAGWVVLILRAALHGTPFGFGGLHGDMLRMSAAATRYTVTVASTDTTVAGLPSEYPPLYAWLVGRAAVLLDQPAWRLLGAAEVLSLSASVLVAFLLWRRQVGSWTALAVACTGVLAWSDPRKAYEVLALMIFIPWVLETFTRPPRARLHWLPAGLLGGLLVVLYQAWLVYAAIGLVAIVLLAWRTEPDRRAYLRRLSLVAGVAFTVSAWYVLPYLWRLVAEGGGQLVSDRYVSPHFLAGLLPFLDIQSGPESDILLRGLQLVGLAGLVWLLRVTWWARPLALVAAAAFGYRLLATVRLMLTGHTGFAHYTVRLYGVVLAIAGVLTIAHVVPILLRRARVAGPVGLVGAPLAVLLGWGVVWYSTAWLPGAGGVGSGYAAAAHTQPLPGGGYPRYAPAGGRVPWFPVEPVRQAVQDAVGEDPRLVTLSVDERLFAYLPWPGYLSNDRTAAATLSRWDERKAQVRDLAGERDPVAFAAASASTEFGPIDVFVLRRDGDDLRWADLWFHRDQFDDRFWTVREDLPERIAVYIRR